MGHFRPFRPGFDPPYFFFFFSLFKQVMDEYKKLLTPIFTFFKKFCGNNGRNCRGIRAVIHSFKVYTINFLMKKKILTDFIMSRIYLR